MQNNNYLPCTKLIKNKYFLVLCFSFKKHHMQNSIYNSLFLGYKYNYLFLNISIFLKTFRKILKLIEAISERNGSILVLHTNNKILNFLLATNCYTSNIYYLSNFKHKQLTIAASLKILPDLVISFDYKANAVFLHKLGSYEVPAICLTSMLNSNIIDNMFYYLVFNNRSLYSNIIIMYLIFNTIGKHKQILGSDSFSKDD